MKPSTRSGLKRTTRQQIALRQLLSMGLRRVKDESLRSLMLKPWKTFLISEKSQSKRKFATKYIDTIISGSNAIMQHKPYMYRFEKKSGYILGPRSPKVTA